MNVTADVDIKFAGRWIARRETRGGAFCLPDWTQTDVQLWAIWRKCSLLWRSWFSQRWLWRLKFSRMWPRVFWQNFTAIMEKNTSSIFDTGN